MATKRTYQPKKRKRSKSCGFRGRMKTKGGQKVLARRRKKKREKITNV
jgi:large subunit ribosomal protein L34